MLYEECIKNYKDSRKEQIIIEAAQMFLTLGIEPVKMTDIAKQCDIGVASLYRYFGTKTGIVIAAGSLLWNDLNKLFDEMYESENFHEKTGKEQIRELMNYITSLFASHKSFLRFIADFDSFVLANRVTSEELCEYEENVLNFYPLFSECWLKGRNDGSIRKDVDQEDVYFSVLHALISMSQKFIKGEILSNDNFSSAEKELNLIIDMAINYISA